MRPLWALLQMPNEIGDVAVTVQHVGIPGMFIEVALGLVKRHLRQCAGVDCLDELTAAEPAVPQVLGARCGAGARLAK